MALKSFVPALALAALTGGAALAAPVDPEFQTFGDIDSATATDVTFGGSGIPTTGVFSTFEVDNARITLGLAAHQRFFNPPLANDGAGTFFATPGFNDGDPDDGVDGSPSTTSGATWNFAWFIEVEGGSIDDFDIRLLFDFDPGVDTDDSELGIFDFAQLINDFGLDPSINQSSQNPAFGFLTDESLSFITAPAFGGFDPFTAGEFSFALRSSAGQVAMNVNVVPVPASAALLGGGLLLLGAARARRRRT